MDVSEFIDTYSDDLICLIEARRALLTHPLGNHFAFSDYVDASFCRITAVFVVGAVEAMLQDWRDRKRDVAHILDKYFDKKAHNGDKVRNLCRAFKDAGIEVDEEVFNDYLAVKYLRNTIVHGGWREHEKEWLDQRGFPTDSRKLLAEHLLRMDHVFQNMMFYIFLTGHMSPARGVRSGSSPVGASAPRGPQKLVKLDEVVTKRTDSSGILSIHDLTRIIWGNLERMNSVLHRIIEQTVLQGPYDWTEGRSAKELEALGHAGCKRLYYLAAWRAGQDGYEPLVRQRELAREALAFWHEYWTKAVSGSDLDDVAIEATLIDLQASSRSASAEALRVGRLVYDLIPNIMPVTLLTLYLPIVDPENTESYLVEADRARRAFRLNRAWYAHVECHHAGYDGALEFYEQMREEFARFRTH